MYKFCQVDIYLYGSRSKDPRQKVPGQKPLRQKPPDNTPR